MLAVTRWYVERLLAGSAALRSAAADTLVSGWAGAWTWVGTALGAVVTYQAFAVSHELIHVGLGWALSRSIATCANGLPIDRISTGYAWPRLMACIPPSSTAVNVLLTPQLTAVLALALALLVAARARGPVTRGAYVGCLFAWALNALYGVGVVTPPAFVDGSVVYVGDGVRALNAFGPRAMVPGACVLALGGWLLHYRGGIVEPLVDGG